MSASGAVGAELAGFIHRTDAPATPGGLGDGWTLLLLHGTGGDERQLSGLGAQLLPGAAQLSPRGNVLEGGAPRFFARLALNQFDLAEVERGADALAVFIRAAGDAYEIDPARMIAMGYSNGANVALAAALRHTGLLRGGVLLRAMPILAPGDDEPLAGVDLLALGGARDPLVDSALYERLVAESRAAGATVTAHVEPGTGHELAQGDLDAARAWLAELVA